MGWQIQVSENEQLVFAGESDPPVELGRQADRSETPYSLKQIDDNWRVVIAPLEEHNVSRRHALVETAPEKCVRITNLSTQQPVSLVDSSDIPPHDSCVAPLPVTFTVGNKTIRIQENEADDVPLRSLEEAASPPGRPSVTLATVSAPTAGQAALESPHRRLQRLLAYFHSPTYTSAFL